MFCFCSNRLTAKSQRESLGGGDRISADPIIIAPRRGRQIVGSGRYDTIYGVFRIDPYQPTNASSAVRTSLNIAFNDGGHRDERGVKISFLLLSSDHVRLAIPHYHR